MAGGAGGFIGGFNPLDQDPIEYSGKWGLKEQIQAIAAGRWTGIPTFELYAWGQNAPEGRLGDNTRINRSSPVQVSNTVKWEQPAAGYDFAAALATDGTLWTWGQAGNGQLGGNNNFPTRSSPVQVGTLTNWGSLAAGHEHCHAIKTDGTLWSWGKATDYGQLGDNTKISKSSPIQIGARTDWSQVSAFFHTSAATTTSGQLFTWGRNNYGQLADNTTFSRSSPVQVGALTNWAQASAGLAACAAIKTDGALWNWGAYALGNGSSTRLSSPVQVGALTNWAQVSMGRLHALAITTTGQLYGWGIVSYGSLPGGTSYSPVQIGALTTWSYLSAGSGQSSALKTDGTLWVWGRNTFGQVGDGTTIDRSSPVQIGASTSWARLTTSRANNSSQTFAIEMGASN